MVLCIDAVMVKSHQIIVFVMFLWHGVMYRCCDGQEPSDYSMCQEDRCYVVASIRCVSETLSMDIFAMHHLIWMVMPMH